MKNRVGRIIPDHINICETRISNSPSVKIQVAKENVDKWLKNILERREKENKEYRNLFVKQIIKCVEFGGFLNLNRRRVFVGKQEVLGAGERERIQKSLSISKIIAEL